ncbi:MAG: hypothetical protein ABI721_04010 [Candidatus Dojkabacteria bacterium]
MKNLKKTLLTILGSLSIFSPLVLHAQALDITGNKLNIDPIIIPFFPVFGSINPQYFTVLSWITFAGSVIIILVIILWIVRILLAGLDAVRSEGDPEKLSESYKKIQASLVGVALTFLIPILLTVIGFVLGIGSIFNWPKMFSGCPNTEYEYYFKAYFNAPAGEDPTTFASQVCGLSSQN